MKKKRVVLETTDGKTHFITSVAPIKSVNMNLDYTVFTYVGGYRQMVKTNTLTAIHVATARP